MKIVSFKVILQLWLIFLLEILLKELSIVSTSTLSPPVLFFKLYFIDYAITVVPVFPPWPSPPITSHCLRPFPHHCSCPWVMRISSSATPFPVLYFTCPWLFCNYLVVLLCTLTSSPIIFDWDGLTDFLFKEDEARILLIVVIFYNIILFLRDIFTLWT